MKKVQFILISFILSLGLIISSAFLAIAVDRSNKSENEITLKGVAERRIKADKAVVNVIMSTKNEEIEKAKTNILEKQTVAVDILKSLEIKDVEYNIENLKIKPVFIKDTNKISNYEVMQTITVTAKNVDEIDKIYEKLEELKLSFNNLEVTKPQFYITNIEKYKKDMLIDASKNAENKAYEILKVNKSNVGELKNLNQGQFELLQDKEDLKRVNEDEINQMYKKMRVVVTATYSVNNNKK